MKAAQELLAATQMQTTLDKTMDQIISTQMSAAPQLAPYKDALRAFYTKYLGWDAMKDDYAKLYVETFTEQELKDITAFYLTPTGKKSVELMPTLIAKGTQIGQQRLMAHMPELQQIMMDAQKKQGH
jgi:hypothetical protein